jgi:asparagine synthase (glutamine-hydrolysing)
MFAFAIWDEKRRELFLARDRFGQKPLFYGVHDGRVYFGSECKAIVAADGFPRRPDRDAIARYLLLQYVPYPASGYLDIRQLPPAHHLTVRAGSGMVPQPQRYWSVPVGSTFRGTFETAVEQVRATLDEAVRMRMIADVPLGAFLSGGIDSTCIVGLMSGHDANPVKACCIGFEEKAYTEEPYARMAAERFGADLHVEIVRARDTLDELDRLTYFYDEPFADSSALPTYCVSRLARRRVTVALTGDAGDELFGGYHRYHRLRVSERLRSARFLRWATRQGLYRRATESRTRTRLRGLLRFLALADLPTAARYLKLTTVFDPDMLRSLCDAGHGWPEGLPSWDYLSMHFHPDGQGAEAADHAVGQAMIADSQGYLPGAMNTKVDRASMAVSLEVRSPFQDHKLAELAFSLPPDWRLHGRVNKYVLRRACADLLPTALTRRPKRGFSQPLAQWFRGELRDRFVDTVLSPRALGRGYFRRAAIEALLEQNDRKEEVHGQRLWSLWMLELWHRRFIDRRPEPLTPPVAPRLAGGSAAGTPRGHEAETARPGQGEES